MNDDYDNGRDMLSLATIFALLILAAAIGAAFDGCSDADARIIHKPKQPNPAAAER